MNCCGYNKDIAKEDLKLMVKKVLNINSRIFYDIGVGDLSCHCIEADVVTPFGQFRHLVMPFRFTDETRKKTIKEMNEFLSKFLVIRYCLIFEGYTLELKNSRDLGEEEAMKRFRAEFGEKKIEDINGSIECIIAQSEDRWGNQIMVMNKIVR